MHKKLVTEAARLRESELGKVRSELDASQQVLTALEDELTTSAKDFNRPTERSSAGRSVQRP